MIIFVVPLYGISMTKSIVKGPEYYLPIIIPLTRSYLEKADTATLFNTAASVNCTRYNCFWNLYMVSTQQVYMICLPLNMCHIRCVTRVCWTISLQNHNIWAPINLLDRGHTVKWLTRCWRSDMFYRLWKQFRNMDRTLSNLMYKPYLTLCTNHTFYLFQILRQAFTPLICIRSSHHCLELYIESFHSC